MHMLRFSISLALLAALPADALLLQQGATRFDIDPATLQIASGNTIVNQAQARQTVADLQSAPTQARWLWADSAMQVSVKLEDGDLRLSFSSSRAQTLNWFTLPQQASTLLLPIGEGSRIPLDNAVWQRYLVKEMTPLDTNWDLKLPLWSQEQQGKVYSWLLLTPFSNQVSFTGTEGVFGMRSSHQFNRFNQQQAFDVLLHVGETPLSGARRYRQYLQQSGQFSSLRDKIRTAPDGEKLIGATHIYLWGDKLLAPADVKNWPGLLSWLSSPPGETLRQKMDADSQKALRQLAGKTPEGWQQLPLIDALNQALITLTPLNATPDDSNFLEAQRRQAANVRELAQRQLGAYLTPADNWGQGLAKPLIEALHQAGLPRLWLSTDNWTAEFLHPQAVESAREFGYLIASYDSYDTAIPRGVNDSWLTAQLPTALREDCAIVRADGTKKPGFGKQGYYLNPGCVLPYSQRRMRDLVQLAGLNSLFLDVDGTGMVSDDYQPHHPTGAAQMAQARNARLAWFSDTLKLPLGSEDGNAVTARHIMFAHGMETWGFGWGDKQMNQDKASPYYLGAWWPNAQPAFFFSPAKVKEPYRTVEFDPRYRLPLYQAVFHDAVISSHHWNYDNLKFSDVKTARSLLSQLYNTAPMFHLSRATLQARLPEIKRADAAFRPLHQVLWDKALTDFRWLDSAGSVQQTTFSDGSTLIANFGSRPFEGIAAQSLRAKLADGRILNIMQ
ncbi:glycoside hydrolase [Serratia sp. root2]|uniref:glycoside hydrolase n=1 Tax=Serratia sp. root2 TaxID=3059676 RepID=UPI00288FA200|nr:glycoside hydrolase [Serratia sp. root2]MDT3249819.1 glycoside hydrolase [Serratia sp. root2]